MHTLHHHRYSSNKPKRRLKYHLEISVIRSDIQMEVNLNLHIQIHKYCCLLRKYVTTSHDIRVDEISSYRAKIRMTSALETIAFINTVLLTNRFVLSNSLP
jgi:hypothetical protein